MQQDQQNWQSLRRTSLLLTTAPVDAEEGPLPLRMEPSTIGTMESVKARTTVCVTTSQGLRNQATRGVLANRSSVIHSVGMESVLSKSITCYYQQHPLCAKPWGAYMLFYVAVHTHCLCTLQT